MKTVPTYTLTPAEAARSVNCGHCRAVPGVPCQAEPEGDHIARYARAWRRGLLPLRDVPGLDADVITAWTVVTP